MPSPTGAGWLLHLLRPRRRRRAVPPVACVEASLARLERLLARVQHDVERVKLHTGLVLRPDRAIALLATGERIYVDPRDGGCGMNLLSEGKYEEDEIRLFRSFLRPGAAILDVGANYGYYSIVSVPYIRPGGRVWAFEPNPHIHDLLTSSLYINGFLHDVEPRRLGVSDAAGELPFAIDEASPGGAHFMRPDARPRPEKLVTTVPTARLDDELPHDLVVDLVKIDVEGHEEFALRGMAELIARSPDIAIFMELFPPLLDDDEAYRRLMGLITGTLGLRLHRVQPGGRTVETDAEALRGEICTLILSRSPLRPRPDLTIHAVQLNRGARTELRDNALVWSRQAHEAEGGLVAHGPYVFLPKGRYRLILDGEFDGSFLCWLQENYGQAIWEARIGPGRGFQAEVELALDAPRLEVVFWPATGGDAAFRFTRAEFWPL